MPIECVWYDEPPEGPWHAGWCFPFGFQLSHRYREHDMGSRPPISVCVPMRHDTAFEVEHGFRRGTVFCVDAYPTDKPEGSWTVSVTGPLVPGQRPPITVHPSLHAVGIYHGWLTDGVLSDDLGN